MKVITTIEHTLHNAKNECERGVCVNYSCYTTFQLAQLEELVAKNGAQIYVLVGLRAINGRALDSPIFLRPTVLGINPKSLHTAIHNGVWREELDEANQDREEGGLGTYVRVRDYGEYMVFG